MSATPTASNPSPAKPNVSSSSSLAKSDSRPASDQHKGDTPQQMAEKPSSTVKPVEKTPDAKAGHRQESQEDAEVSKKKDGSPNDDKSSSAPQSSSPSAVKQSASQAVPTPATPAPTPPQQQQPQQAAALSPQPINDAAVPTLAPGLPPAAAPATTSLQACKKPADCPSKICISGVCAVSSGFSLQTIPSNPPGVSSGSIVGHRAGPVQHGPQTACSDPRCHLPADLKGLNDPESDIAPPGSSNAKLLSDAGIAGLVLALLFVMLFLLLVVPKVRAILKDKIADWRNEKDAANAKREIGKGSPDFGNEDASTFEKRDPKYASSFVSPGHISGSPLPSQQYAQYFSQQEGQYTMQYQPGQTVPHEIVYMGGEKAEEKAQVEGGTSFTGQGARRKAISFAADLQKPNKAALPASLTDGALNRSQRAPRETVLPYTVGFEDDTDALAALRGIASPLIQNNANTLGPVTPTMQSGSTFSPHTPDNASSPTTPGSAYSSRTALLSSSLQARTRQPIISPVHIIPRNPVPPLAYGAGNTRPGLQRLPSLKITPSSMISDK